MSGHGTHRTPRHHRKFTMSNTLQLARLGAALALCGTTWAHALPVLANTNLDGSQGLNGWQAVGDVAVIDAATGPVGIGLSINAHPTMLALGTATTFDWDDANAAAGTYSVSHNADPAYDTDLVQVSQALGLGSVAALGADAFEGSALSRSLSVSAGTTVSFQWRAWTRTPVANIGSQNDALWFTASGVGQVATTAPMATLQSLFVSGTPAGTPNGWLDSGWRSVSFTVAQSGALNLGWAVVDQGSTTDTTVMAIGGLNVVPGVPEPSSLALLVAGLGAALVVQAWRRR